MLERLPGLARAIEVWECDLSLVEQGQAGGDPPACHPIHSSSAVDDLDDGELPWRGPDRLDDWASELIGLT
jgi:hypothetical protein